MMSHRYCNTSIWHSETPDWLIKLDDDASKRSKQDKTQDWLR